MRRGFRRWTKMECVSLTLRIQAHFVVIEIIAFGSKAYGESLELREEVLRKPLGLSLFDADLTAEAKQQHIAYFKGSEICGISVLQPLSRHSLKMRQVAVAKSARGLGIGRALISFAENWAAENDYQTIVLDARREAAPFYKKMGYRVVSESFYKLGIPHYKMQRDI